MSGDGGENKQGKAEQDKNGRADRPRRPTRPFHMPQRGCGCPMATRQMRSGEPPLVVAATHAITSFR